MGAPVVEILETLGYHKVKTQSFYPRPHSVTQSSAKMHQKFSHKTEKFLERGPLLAGKGTPHTPPYSAPSIVTSRSWLRHCSDPPIICDFPHSFQFALFY